MEVFPLLVNKKYEFIFKSIKVNQFETAIFGLVLKLLRLLSLICQIQPYQKHWEISNLVNLSPETHPFSMIDSQA